MFSYQKESSTPRLSGQVLAAEYISSLFQLCFVVICDHILLSFYHCKIKQQNTVWLNSCEITQKLIENITRQR